MHNPDGTLDPRSGCQSGGRCIFPGSVSGSRQAAFHQLNRLRIWDTDELDDDFRPSRPSSPTGRALPSTVPSGGTDIHLAVEGINLSKTFANDATLHRDLHAR